MAISGLRGMGAELALGVNVILTPPVYFICNSLYKIYGAASE
jgi:hypothetical protein